MAFAALIWALRHTFVKIRVEIFFARIETGFSIFTALFWALWLLFCLNRTYLCQDIGCQDMGGNVLSWALKPFLQHLPHFSEHLGGNFASIGCTVAKISRDMFLRKLWNLFYGIRRSFFRTLVAILCLSNVRLPRHGQKNLFAGL